MIVLLLVFKPTRSHRVLSIESLPVYNLPHVQIPLCGNSKPSRHRLVGAKIHLDAFYFRWNFWARFYSRALLRASVATFAAVGVHEILVLNAAFCSGPLSASGGSVLLGQSFLASSFGSFGSGFGFSGGFLFGSFGFSGGLGCSGSSGSGYFLGGGSGFSGSDGSASVGAVFCHVIDHFLCVGGTETRFGPFRALFSFSYGGFCGSISGGVCRSISGGVCRSISGGVTFASRGSSVTFASGGSSRGSSVTFASRGSSGTFASGGSSFTFASGGSSRGS